VDWTDFLGIERTDDPTRWRLPVTPAVAGGAGQLFGGCSFGAAAALLEELTAKPVAWATGQFLSNAFPPETLELTADVLVQGHNFCQARVTGRVGDREVLTVMAALGTKRFGGEGAWRTMPRVPPPERCTPAAVFGPQPGGLSRRLERRVVAGEWGDEDTAPAGIMRVWMRLPGELVGTTLGLAVAADFLPMGLRAGLQRPLFGASLDNTVRFVRRAATEWVLADMQMDELTDGVGHGGVLLWSPDGRLLASASQSCAMRDMPDAPG
jgi:acyl-CoA thioesterase II